MLQIHPLDSPADVDDLRGAYRASLSAPLDGMWEAFAEESPHFEIRRGGLRQGERVGYFCVRSSGHLLQFHLAEDLEPCAAHLFDRVLSRGDVTGAIVGTNDPFLLGLSLDRHRSVRVHSLLYELVVDSETPVPERDGETFTVVVEKELPEIEAFNRAQLDVDLGDWLTGYLEGLVSRRELFVLRRNGEILATGERRKSPTQGEIADLGMIVSRRHRRRGLATEILGRLVDNALERGLDPICSTTVDNKAAQKAIGRAGFSARHRLLEIGF